VSLQGPAWPRCVRRTLSSGSSLRRPCIYSSLLTPAAVGRLCKSNVRWKDLLQAGRDRNAIRQQSRARMLALFFLAMTSSSPVLAKCHIFHIWHYPKPQRCFTALAPFHAKPVLRSLETSQERIEITIPSMDFVPCPDGDERLLGIARLRALEDAQ
jgi:hypothetical protein